MHTIQLFNPFESQSNSYHLSPAYLQLKSHHLSFGKRAMEWEWLDPITYVDGYSYDGLVAEIVSRAPTVLAISVQMWNAQLAMSVGRSVKQLLPSTRVIVGGPHTDHKYNMSWFKHYDFVDALCAPDGYGEDFMTAYLDAVSCNEVDFTKIPNAVYPSKSRSFWKRSPLSTDKREFIYPPSIFVGSDNYVSTIALLAKHLGRTLTLNYETSRGCPYACTFCDWPGGLKSKIIRKPDDVVNQELDDIARYGINEISLTDANFGALGRRDENILRRLVDIAKGGNLTAVTTHGRAKHSVEVVEKMDSILLDAGLYTSDEYTMSINAADDDVLRAIDRVNPKMEKVIEVANRIRLKYGKFIAFEMIMGLPLYTLDKFYAEFDLLAAVEGWLTERNPWSLLTESVGASPEYRAKYGVETARVGVYKGNNFGRQLEDPMSPTTDIGDDVHQSTYEIVVKTSTYTKEEWCEMYIVDHLVRSLELSKLTTKSRKFANSVGVPASVFYRALWTEFSAHDTMRSHIEDIQTQTKSITTGSRMQFEWFDVPLLPGHRLKLEAYFMLIIMTNPATFVEIVQRTLHHLGIVTCEYQLIIQAFTTPQELLEISTNILAQKGSECLRFH